MVSDDDVVSVTHDDVNSGGRIIIFSASGLNAVCNPNISKRWIMCRTWPHIRAKIAIRKIYQVFFGDVVCVSLFLQATFRNRSQRRGSLLGSGCSGCMRLIRKSRSTRASHSSVKNPKPDPFWPSWFVANVPFPGRCVRLMSSVAHARVQKSRHLHQN